MNTVEQELKRLRDELTAKKNTMPVFEYLEAYVDLLRQETQYLASLNYHTRYDGRQE